GRQIKVPVFLRRRPDEQVDHALEAFYRALLEKLQMSSFHEGDWELCERSGWPDNQSYLNLVAWCWRKGEARSLVVVNLSDLRSQGRVRLPWDDPAGRIWRFTDVFTGDVSQRD